MSFSLKFHVRMFLILQSLVCGTFIGVLSCNTKLMIETVKNSNSALELFLNPFFYLFWSLICFALFTNVYNLNVSMRMYSQLYVLPIYESCGIFGNLISGGVIMDEFTYYRGDQLAKIFFGCLISILGILMKLSVLEAKSPEREGDQFDKMQAVEDS